MNRREHLMKQRLASGLILTLALGAAASTAHAEVTHTRIVRDIMLFGTISGDAVDPIHESQTEQSFEPGAFEHYLDLSLVEGDLSAESEGTQFSQITAAGLTSEGSIHATATGPFPENFTEALGSSRIFFDFDVDVPTPIHFSGFGRTAGDGRLSINLIGPTDVHINIFLQNTEEHFDETHVLEPGSYRYSQVMLGFGQNTAENFFADGAYALDLEFLDIANVPTSAVTSIAPAVFPNPASSGMQIQWNRSGDSEASGSEVVKVVDARGRMVRSLSARAIGSVDGTSYRADWDLTNDVGEKVSAGVYYVRTAEAQPVKTVVLR